MKGTDHGDSNPPTAAAPEERRLDRRDFLKMSALAGAGLLAAPALSACAGPSAGPIQAEPAATATPATVAPGNGKSAPGGDGLVSAIDPTKQAQETWVEPWVWRPGDWPGQQLDLNVVENENPVAVVGFGNPSAVLFSYGAITPGPTIRMKGDETLRLRLRNLLGEDIGKTPVGPAPDPAELTPALDSAICELAGNPDGCQAKQYPQFVYEVVPADVREDWCLGEHTNGIHSAHITNLHTHGLHVRPGTNPDGTQSDNVILRLISQADFRRRERAEDPNCRYLRENEQVGEASYEFRIGEVMGDPAAPHPPGTHWYHPHSHGATHNQVASGMAGFLVVEGEVDEKINRAIAGTPWPNPEEKTGPWDYRERLMLIQRVLNTSVDPDAASPQQKSPPSPVINGSMLPHIITMRPGAVERWRVLNGSVDGRGYKRFMVLAGQYEVRKADPAAKDEPKRLYKVMRTAGDPTRGNLQLATWEQIEADKQHLYQLAVDGVTLVAVQDGEARHTIKDLAGQNKGSQNPLAQPPGPGENPNAAMLRNYQDCFRDGQSLFDCYVRPNEVYMGPANRTDLFFRAPAGEEARVYTILAKAVVVHADNYQQNLQAAIAAGEETLIGGPEDIVVAYVIASGQEVEGGDFDVMGLIDHLPPVPPYALPIAADELRIGEKEAAQRGVEAGRYRTRSTIYAGWGAQDFPLIQADAGQRDFQRYVARHPEMENLIFAPHNDVDVLLPPMIRTMSVDGRKFDPTDPLRPRILVDTAEEWVIYNSSIALWGDTDPAAQPPGQYKSHYIAHPLNRGEGQERFAENNAFQIVTKGVDHPFHIHINPFWLMRVEIPDEAGNLYNILPEPRWQDTVWLPRNGGRVVFRSRFPDFVGIFVNHCHLLLHEDNGMMTPVETTQFAEDCNYAASDRVLDGDDPAAMDESGVNAVYARPTLDDSYQHSLRFMDPNRVVGQPYEWPPFEVAPPAPEG